MGLRAIVLSGAYVSVSRRLQHQGNSTARSSRGTMGRRPANPCWLETSWIHAASWQQALSHVQSDLMLHHSRGVTQEELGLTLSGGVWFGHPYTIVFPPPHPTLACPQWRGDLEAFAGSKGIAIRGCGL